MAAAAVVYDALRVSILWPRISHRSPMSVRLQMSLSVCLCTWADSVLFLHFHFHHFIDTVSQKNEIGMNEITFGRNEVKQMRSAHVRYAICITYSIYWKKFPFVNPEVRHPISIEVRIVCKLHGEFNIIVTIRTSLIHLLLVFFYLSTVSFATRTRKSFVDALARSHPVVDPLQKQSLLLR